MLKKPSISVIVCCTAGHINTIKFCLKALLTQKFTLPFEILIVNDGYDKQIGILVEKYEKFLNIRYFERVNDKCLSRSRNIGANNALSDLLVFLDSDVILDQFCIEQFYKLLSGSEVSVWGKCNSPVFKDDRPPLTNKAFENYINSGRNIIIFFRPYCYSFGFLFGMKKNIYFSAGGSDENFIGYGHEDRALSYHLYKNKVKFTFCSDTYAEHIHNSSESSFYSSEYRLNNKRRIKKILKEEFDTFTSIDDDTIRNEFSYLENIIGKGVVFYAYLRYLLCKKYEEEAKKISSSGFGNKDLIIRIWKDYYEDNFLPF